MNRKFLGWQWDDWKLIVESLCLLFGVLVIAILLVLTAAVATRPYYNAQCAEVARVMETEYYISNDVSCMILVDGEWVFLSKLQGNVK